ncbi:hypothetical protein HBHAL_3231 [Halobacillus halophilus DSM 2266]|uniref:Uncharacterized protein n=1 Tax=Halobacillus halophilus (strain ATCC 35676 / DSM 2266 / JCM 20832 / KCTC 3685 / LMG 17431 / NBRC 102448 / NCIMB 2269) TaxID=866895 RepID=I0JN56_HALH3|nr:hypothetical protein HBHAL_3231 [Halobacillus halophilus DSM 2266]
MNEQFQPGKYTWLFIFAIIEKKKEKCRKLITV